MDRQVAGRDPAVADLLEKFVCVRIVQANGMDLSLFQFDYNLTWAVVFLNADRTVYGRYGSRSSHDPNKDMSIESFRKAMEGALELHAGYPANKASLGGKTGPKPRHPTPEGYPTLKKFYTPVITPGKPDSCMHCHQITNNEFRFYRGARQPIPDETLFDYPMPDTLGLSLDRNERATVSAVAAGSSAEKDGFKAGDQILSLEGQPLVSIADVQWVLTQAKKATRLKAEVKRGVAAQSLTLSLPAGWRRKGDISWRGSNEIISPIPDESEDLPADEKKKLGLAAAATAIRVKWAGRGFQRDDVIVEADGKRTWTASELLAYVAQQRMPGDKLSLTVLRAGKEQKLQLTLEFKE